jgi:hypothetical protein
MEKYDKIDPGSTVILTPEWIKLASEEIAEKFNLDFWGKIEIGAIIYKQFRLHGTDNIQRACCRPEQ